MRNATCDHAPVGIVILHRPGLVVASSDDLVWRASKRDGADRRNLKTGEQRTNHNVRDSCQPVVSPLKARRDNCLGSLCRFVHTPVVSLGSATRAAGFRLCRGLQRQVKDSQSIASGASATARLIGNSARFPEEVRRRCVLVQSRHPEGR